MRKRSSFFIFFAIFFSAVAVCHAGLFDNIIKGLTCGSQAKTDVNTIISGLKEALSIGTQKAINNVSQRDGYFSNEIIKIIMPEKIHIELSVNKHRQILGRSNLQQEFQ